MVDVMFPLQPQQTGNHTSYTMGDGETSCLTMLSEEDKGKIMSLISSLSTMVSSDFERAYEEFQAVLDKYQEQPRLLDNDLQAIADSLLRLLPANNDETLEAHVFKFFCHLTKVRGYKVIIRHLPHEVKDVQDKGQEAAAFLLAMCLSRPDGDAQIGEVIAELCAEIDTVMTEECLGLKHQRYLLGLFGAIAGIFKHGKRETCAVSGGPRTMEMLEAHFSRISPVKNGLLRKLFCKVAQWVALDFLKPQVAAWRYERGIRSLSQNLGPGGGGGDNQASQMKGAKELEDAQVCHEWDQVEKVLNWLLSAFLFDSDTIVRWSAAKGVGRITSRLPKDLGDEVASWVIKLIDDSTSDQVWHGGCFALAELARRGFLLPHRLKEVVPVVLKALTFEELKGRYSIGGHVRDAACYVIWAFARAYHPDDLKDYVENLASQLLIVALFDREINCRKAASAAFQENVGRQGSFPNGIYICTIADYFAVGNISRCYESLCIQVAKFPEYTAPIIAHVSEAKCVHWDSNVRVLSGKALRQLTSIAPQKFAYEILPDFVAKAAHAQLFISRSLLRKGIGAELMKEAVGDFIWNFSNLKLAPHSHALSSANREIWWSILMENLVYVDAQLRENGQMALGAFLRAFYADEPDDVIRSLLEEMTTLLTSAAQERERMGMALAIGVTPLQFLQVLSVEQVLKLLAQYAKVGGSKDKLWAEARRDCLTAISNIVEASPDLDESIQNLVLDTFLSGLDDYTVDKRGDIGVYVRKASISGLCKLFRKFPQTFPADKVQLGFCKLLQQSCEKIDKNREEGARCLAILLHNTTPEVVGVPCRDELKAVFIPDLYNEASLFSIRLNSDWLTASYAYSNLAKLLPYPVFHYYLLLGFTISAGNMTEYIMKPASEALLTYIGDISENKFSLLETLKTFGDIFQQFSRQCSRITLPLLKVLEQLFSSGYMYGATGTSYMADVGNEEPETSADLLKAVERLIDLTLVEISGIKHVEKLLSGLALLCSALSFPNPVMEKALAKLLTMFTHPWPRVRKFTAEKFYEAVLGGSIVLDNHNEQVMCILEGTDWGSDDLEQLKEIRNELASTFGIELV